MTGVFLEPMSVGDHVWVRDIGHVFVVVETENKADGQHCVVQLAAAGQWGFLASMRVERWDMTKLSILELLAYAASEGSLL
jgi:hypothetical protein